MRELNHDYEHMALHERARGAGRAGDADSTDAALPAEAAGPKHAGVRGTP